MDEREQRFNSDNIIDYLRTRKEGAEEAREVQIKLAILAVTSFDLDREGKVGDAIEALVETHPEYKDLVLQTIKNAASLKEHLDDLTAE